MSQAAEAAWGRGSGNKGELRQGWGQLPASPFAVAASKDGPHLSPHTLSSLLHPHLSQPKTLCFPVKREGFFFMISLPLSSEHEGITEDTGGREAGPVPIRAPLGSAHSGPASSKGSKRPISCELGGRGLLAGRCTGSGMAKQGPRDGACHTVVQKYRRRDIYTGNSDCLEQNSRLSVLRAGLKGAMG